MLGVVLWSDASDRKAVIWCEDQGDLAYVSEFTSAMNSGDFFDAGDLVQFDMEMRKSMRLANNPRLVIEKAGRSLPKALLDGAEQKRPSGRRSGQVIHFSPKARNVIPAE